ncbi:MAG: lipoate--protein ligase family protein [Polaromonas sp.]|uniref:lipoate--protein ligase family protein n=1 Tax=Polaromonas sp. TaxID=1869339 RepID=UPI004036F207
MLGRAQRDLFTCPVLPLRQRSSGGGAVLRGPWLLRAAVRLPPGHELARHGPIAAARWFGQVHQQWLQAQGITDTRLSDGPTVAHWACFAGRGPGELMVGERKMVGIAQTWRQRAILLAAGTLVAEPPWHLLCTALGRPPEEAGRLASVTVCAADCLGHGVDAGAWADALRDRLEQALDIAREGVPCA